MLKVVRGIFRQSGLYLAYKSYLGQDATEAFEDVGHSDEARALLPDMLIGEFEKGSVGTILMSIIDILLTPATQNVKLKSGAAAAQAARVSGAVEKGSKYVGNHFTGQR